MPHLVCATTAERSGENFGSVLELRHPINRTPAAFPELLAAALKDDSEEHSRQSRLIHDPRHPHYPVPDGGVGSSPTRQ